MKRIPLLIAGLMLFSTLQAEEIVKDGKGRSILLRDDFTWEYRKPNAETPELPVILNKGDEMTDKLESQTGKFTIFYDPSLWKQTEPSKPSIEFQLNNTDETGFALVIFDGIQIPLDQMKDVLIMNAEKVDANAHIIGSQSCIVNGVPCEIVTYTAKSRSVRLMFYTLLVAREEGTVQFTFFTLEPGFEKLKPTFQRAMAGFMFGAAEGLQGSRTVF